MRFLGILDENKFLNWHLLQGDGKVFVYDENGNLIQKTDEDGYVTTYEQSPLNLVSKVNYQDGRSASYLYNGTGELIEMTDWNGTTTFSRDLLNRLTQVNDHKGRTTGYTWDNVGNQTAITYPDATAALYEYDAENRLVKATDWFGKESLFEYDEEGNRTLKKYGNGEAERYRYDGNGRMTDKAEYNVRGRETFVYQYSWDENGNRTGEVKCKPEYPQNQYGCNWEGGWGTPIVNKSYTYDKNNRLTEEYDGLSLQRTKFSYDSLGNLTIETRSHETVKYEYNQLNQLTRKHDNDGTTNYSYDKRGNRTGYLMQNWMYSACSDYSYDASNRLTEGNVGTGPDRLESRYTYNGLGVRVNNRSRNQLKWLLDRDYVIDYTSEERNDLMTK